MGVASSAVRLWLCSGSRSCSCSCSRLRGVEDDVSERVLAMTSEMETVVVPGEGAADDKDMMLYDDNNDDDDDDDATRNRDATVLIAIEIQFGASATWGARMSAWQSYIIIYTRWGAAIRTERSG
mmetsp:Transcript_27010/g.55801  ORF Transcript_27010/g.55801 Transcript_27010/m.55801 type:complete len:125 (+) Transcript_27010:204-578(+)